MLQGMARMDLLESMSALARSFAHRRCDKRNAQLRKQA